MSKPRKHSPKRIRTWIIGSYAVIVCILALLWGYSLFTPINHSEEEQQYQSLESIANSTSVALESSDLNAQEIVTRVGSGANLRVTAIGTDGDVLADSSDDAKIMENHLQRPEIEEALKGGVGHDRRVSSTDGTEYLYVAILSSYKGDPVILRVCTPTSKVNSLAQDLRNSGLVLLIVSLFLTIAIAWLAFKKTTEPVTHLEQVRTDFVANASHELKTPVAGISLLAESIEQASESGEDELVVIFAKRLRKESARLQSLVTELLDLSRLENGGLDGRKNQHCDFASIVATSFDAHVLQAQQKHLAYSYDDQLANGQICRIMLPPADASLLVDNLIENAINYTEEGSVTVTLRKLKHRVVLEVADTGLGIPTADQERIFERFYRVDTARSREMGGTGLGLSLVRHAVNRACGNISLDSKAGEGSRFTVALPLV